MSDSAEVESRLIGQWPTGSPSWHDARAGRIGGSEISAILGVSPYESAFGLWLRKSGSIGGQEVNDQMTVGTYVEDAVCRWWLDTCGASATLVDGGTYVHAERTWQLANPDRLVYGPGRKVSVLEAKFQIFADGWGPDGSDEVPPYYLAQCRWYLDVLDLDVAHVAVLFGQEGRFGRYTIRSDREDAELMRYEARRFLDSIAAGERPPIDSHEATWRAIREQHPDIDPTLGADIDPEAHATYQWAKAERDSSAARHRQASAVVLDQMGGARIGTVAGIPRYRRQPGSHGSVALHEIKERTT